MVFAAARSRAWIPQPDFSGDCNDGSPPDSFPLLVAAAATAAFSAMGTTQRHHISVRQGGVNWKMGKLAWDQAVARGPSISRR
jgi:hypothetical protein